ncbi:hypothetical protein C4561_04465 [candidate division WWE3 bacterium]|uniref:Uncharacterized protein n=1 Tax=candidate division WWE3 bacterium TaxID=2053526 RepID=A0A3A4ZCQ7_UNCKA|nr:MAG: hypothetical protein C4561_04465 [candidate division WWE3 bacterium]
MKAIRLFLIFLFIFIVLLTAFIAFNQMESARISNSSLRFLNFQLNNNNKMITDYEVDNCDIYIFDENDNKKKIARIMDLGNDEGLCNVEPSISLSFSNKYLAFTDIMGGVDSAVRIYSVNLDKVTTLYVYGTSSVMDIEFTYEDILTVLNGYPDSYDEQYVIFYNIPGLYEKYEQNVTRIARSQDYFKITDTYKKNFKLPNVGKSYISLVISTDTMVVNTEKSQDASQDYFEVIPYSEYTFRKKETASEIATDKTVENLKYALEKANYCQQATDCKAVSYGFPFECFNLVNKNENLTQIETSIKLYQKDKVLPIYDCDRWPYENEITCENNKCVDARYN